MLEISGSEVMILQHHPKPTVTELQRALMQAGINSKVRPQTSGVCKFINANRGSIEGFAAAERLRAAKQTSIMIQTFKPQAYGAN